MISSAPFPNGVPFEALEIWQEKYLENPVEYMRAASPYYQIEKAKKLPPFLFVQGDDGAVVLFDSSRYLIYTERCQISMYKSS